MKIEPNGETIEAAHIGFDVIAKAATRRIEGKAANCSLVLVSEDGADEGAYFPAQCVKIHGLAGVKKLRELCDQALQDIPKPD